MSALTEGERVATFRTRRGLSQDDLAAKMRDAGWNIFRQATISCIEKDERPIRLREALGLAEALGVTLADLAGVGNNLDLIEQGRRLEREHIIEMIRNG